MATREQLELIKRATVAIALVPDTPPSDPRQTPFTILGSGFCVDPAGVVVTCEHVVSAFVSGDIRQAIAEVPHEDREGELWPIRDVQMLRPFALFYTSDESNRNLVVLMVPMASAVAKLDYDLGFIRLERHAAFREGFPFLEIEDYDSLFEGMDVATCGFPLGNTLHDQLGTKTSSFTRGILSSIAPAPGVEIPDLRGFQLDLTATHGNSGGPVFSWETGRVFGVLQGGPTSSPGVTLPGLAFAESLHRPIADGTIDRVLATDGPSVAS